MSPEISIILPCQNEEKGLPICLAQIKKIKLPFEIIVSDSSTDSSPEIAKKFGVKLVKHNKNGYGNAVLEGIKASSGKYIFLADADGTYDFSEIPRFIKALKNADLVIGNRFAGQIIKMPFLRRFVGNPILSKIIGVHDSQSGMRAFRKDFIDKLNLKATGMEFASEMIIKAIKNGCKITELPINYYKRVGISKLKPFPDAWKHIKLIYEHCDFP